MTLYPNQASFTRGEVSPRLHSRASLELYQSALSRCLGFITLPHGGIRKAGGTYFVAEVKDSSKAVRGFPFIFSKDQAYCLEVGNLYIRVYAYGARVGAFEIVTPWVEADLDELMFYQSADEMWIVHPSYEPQILTRTAHLTWTLEEFIFDDGPYLPINETATTLTPAATGAVHPKMTSNTAPSGTVAATGGSASAFQVFDQSVSSIYLNGSLSVVAISYDFAGATTKVCDAYWLRADDKNTTKTPLSWTFEGFDGANWIVLDTRSGEAGWIRNEYRYYEFNNKTAYQAYRLNTTATDTDTQNDLSIAEMGWHESGDTQTPFNLTASSIVGINDDQGFLATDVGRAIRLLGNDNRWRWARIAAWVSPTIVTVRLYDHALPNLNAIVNWRMSVFDPDTQVSAVTVFEERLAFAQRFSVYASRSFEFENFATGEADDDALAFTNAGGGQANDIVWLADADGFLVVATTSGIRALSGSGFDEALTPSSFKNRKSRTYGCAKVAPVDAGQSFLYVTRSRKALAELVQNSTGRFTSDDIGQISEHIPKKGIVELAFQTDPDPMLWFPLQNGELGGYTHQPSQEVRGMYRRRAGGSFTGSDWPIVERAVVTPNQEGTDDVWLFVKRTVNGVTRRYIEIATAPFEYGEIEDAFCIDCGLTYEGAAVTVVSGASHLAGETVDVLASGKVYKGLVVSGAGQVTLPVGSAAAAKWQLGLPFPCEADTLELDVGARDGSLMGRRKRITKVILSVFETDMSGLQISSLIKGKWEQVKVPTIAVPTGMASLYTGNVEVPIDDSWAGQGRVSIRHTNPTPCTIRAISPAFDFEP